MPKPTRDTLLGVEAGLTRSFVACAVGVTALLLWTFIAVRAEISTVWANRVAAALVACEFACYVWYAVAVGAAAGALEKKAWAFVLWVLAAPVLSLTPVPVVSTLIAVSPLSIKFLLAGQLQSEIREATFPD